MINHRGENIVFLLSMPRSGSTLLSLMLGSHPEICCPPEPWIVLAVAEYLDLGNVSSTPYGREWGELAAIEFLLNAERKKRGALGSTLRRIGETPRPDTITTAREILRAVYQMHLDVSGKRIFVDKTPRYYTVLELVEELFPRAKKIVLLRDPLDIFASYKAIWEISQSIFMPEGVAVHTRDFCQGLFVLADYTSTVRDDVLVLRYEDLACDPERVLRAVCQFADIDFSSRMLGYHENTPLLEEYRRSPVGDPISSNQPKPPNHRTVNAWENRLDRTDIQALIDVLGTQIFERLGYGDTATRLRDMAVKIPSEEQAVERRNLLMQCLVDRVHEQPFSAWGNFVSPLKESQADRAARLEIIHQQRADLDGLRQQYNASEVDRAARMRVIQRQQEELDRLRSFFGFASYRFGNLRRWIYRKWMNS